MQAREAIRAIDPPADPVSDPPARRREGRQRLPSPAYVLVVEDDRRLAHSLRRGLEEAGMEAAVAHDGKAALNLVRHAAYDVVVLDVQLPGIDGFTLCRAIRQRESAAGILLVTARDAGEDRLAGARAGADGYVLKPFALHELVGRVRALAHRAHGRAPAVLAAGPLLLDPDSRQVQVSGRPVALTGKEFDILEYFMLHPGRVLHQTRLLENVWSYDFDGGRNLVEVYMGRLRRKLRDAGLPDPFRTVRGAGYRFDRPR